MCGITGVFAFTEAGLTAFNRLKAAAAAIQHRGPDASGTFVRDKVALAHQRLTVIAPSATANQPLTDTTGRYTIVYNGEIFNYKSLQAKLIAKGQQFTTDSDTEVILQLYIREGQECLKRLHGFFAFAIYDAAEQSLFIARDRFGEKPLLYYKDADKFLFGSELKALMALGVPRELDYTSLFQYLQLTYIPAPATILKNVKKLLPGHFLLVKNNKVHDSNWYKLPFDGEKAASNTLTYKQQQVKLRQLLEQAVTERLVSDVPVGAFLSGGIDSSIVVALASEQVPSLQTFSVGFPEQPFFDETSYARLVARKYNTNHTEVRLTNHDLYTNIFGMLDGLSEPFADSSALAVYSLSKQVSRQLKVVLSGDGADELFAGYNKHRAELQAQTKGATTELVTALGFLWENLPKSRNSFISNKVRQLHRFAAGAKLSAPDRYWLWATWQQEQQALALLKPEHKNKAVNRLYVARKSRLLECLTRNHYDLNSVLCADWQLVLANDMLPKTDLMGMANSLEIRSPFLDHRVVKFAFSLPVASKIDKSYQKRILQDTFRHMLPAELYKRPKKGFEIPLLSFLQTEGAGLVDQYLSDELVEAQQLFDVAQIRKLRQSFKGSAGGALQTQVWMLLVFQYWWENSFLPDS
ncbi:asparagine synthase (glutamine-hydrolyzing) [Pontibacter sp. KCTC 32443]|uniref:asparagine synthase (glutamine-hydrolyzing) n=1 Tax=Pontibacter TaxID=323449 RepID=UPI00164DA790|nr:MULTISPECIES: asparagine synthase (glutamine-hydrolyzing) [Pontibacter]MBC5775461.1 asparagine synthase (glutamine-hydrolyzing) [Pontibacter sp. KCTC 32443]